MVEKKLIEQQIFYGRPFPSSQIDQTRSYAAVNQAMEADPTFTKFLTENNLQNQRCSLIEFAVDNFMYWYGVLCPASQVVNYQGLLKFELPTAQVAVQETTGDLASLNLPINVTIPQFLAQVDKAGIKYYENLGESETPYVLQAVDLSAKKLTQELYLKASL